MITHHTTCSGDNGTEMSTLVTRSYTPFSHNNKTLRPIIIKQWPESLLLSLSISTKMKRYTHRGSYTSVLHSASQFPASQRACERGGVKTLKCIANKRLLGQQKTNFTTLHTKVYSYGAFLEVMHIWEFAFSATPPYRCEIWCVSRWNTTQIAEEFIRPSIPCKEMLLNMMLLLGLQSI